LKVGTWAPWPLAFVAGISFPLAFAPFHYALVGPLALAVLFLLWSGVSAQRAAGLGLMFGIGSFGIGVSWVFVSLHHYGNMPTALAVGITVVFILILSFYLAAGGFCQAGWQRLPMGLRLIVLMPAMWVLMEWLRGWLLGGFPWMYLGYSQLDTPLAGFAPLGGVLGVSFLSAVTAGSVAWGVHSGGKAWAGATGLIVLIMLGTAFVGRSEPVMPIGDALKVAVIQNNISLSDKWQIGNTRGIRERYLAASIDAGDADLIVWPEAALPEFLDGLSPDFLQDLSNHPADFVIGLLERRQQRGYLEMFNSALGIGDKHSVYRKQQLVVFGEYLPLRPLLGWLLRYLDIPMSDFSSWQERQAPMALAGQQVGVTICYEDAFPWLVRRSLPEATMLVNISEDAWFGDSLAPHQRLQMARFRALESGRALVRASNNGLSALIDRRGQVLQLAPQFSPVVLSGMLQPATGTTVYVRYGDAPLIIGLLLLLVIAFLVNTKVAVGGSTRDVTIT
jgi:apolipoprotein N-acyltransferase